MDNLKGFNTATREEELAASSLGAITFDRAFGFDRT